MVAATLICIVAPPRGCGQAKGRRDGDPGSRSRLGGRTTCSAGWSRHDEVVSRNPTYDEDSELINNRQNGRRGRGRNGVRPQGGGGTGRPEQGNRIDNRARGNAAQLLEKYKALARDAQMASDRVMTEYYLQFADHYFRVLADTRARFDEQRRPQGEQQQGGANTFQDEYDGDDGEADITDSFDDPRPDQQPRYQDRGNRNDRNDRNDNDRGGQQNGQRGDAAQNGQQDGRQDRPQRQDRDRGQNERPHYADRQQNDRAQGDGQQNGYQQDRGPRPDRNDRNDRNDRQGNGQQERPFRPRDQQDRGDRPERQPRQPRDDGQERGHEGQTYRTIRAEPDRGPVPSPIAAQQQPREMTEASADEAPRRTRARRPVTEQQQPTPVADAPVADAPLAAAPVASPAPAVDAPAAPAEEAPRRTRRARVAAPVETAGNDQDDMLTLPPAFLSTPADAAPAEEKPRRRRRTRAEIDADNGDVAA